MSIRYSISMPGGVRRSLTGGHRGSIPSLSSIQKVCSSRRATQKYHPMASIFISYRRNDSRFAAGWIHDRLVRAFSSADVFIDIADIPYGRDFRQLLMNKVAQCSVLLAIIGPGWLDARDDSGASRIEDPNDLVRIEVSSALAHPSIIVIPVLVGGAAMPPAGRLPADLRDLAGRNAISIDDAKFSRDVDELIETVGLNLGRNRRLPSSHISKRLLFVVTLLAVTTTTVAWQSWSRRTVDHAKSNTTAEEISPVQLRIAAADCRSKGLSQLQNGYVSDARASFLCAEDKLLKAITRGDNLSLWGLALIYGDPKIQNALPQQAPGFYAGQAAIYWCRAREQGVAAATIQPPFGNVTC